MSALRVKAHVDCSGVGALDRDAAEAHAADLRATALLALGSDPPAVDKAQALLAEAKDVLAGAVADTYQVVDLDLDEIAAYEQHYTEQADLATATAARHAGELVARCDRWLAQTDWIMAPAAARPSDMSPGLAAACDANQKQWKAWRGKVRAARDAATAGGKIPDIPDPPAAPEVTLT